MPQPLCFVLMSFGRKRDPAGGPDIDFDRTYEMAVRPAILEAKLDPIRADQERGNQPDYWDHATLLELSVLAAESERAREHLNEALASVREYWEPETTARNLALLRDARLERDEPAPWLGDILASLEAAVRERKGA